MKKTLAIIDCDDQSSIKKSYLRRSCQLLGTSESHYHGSDLTNVDKGPLPNRLIYLVRKWFILKDQSGTKTSLKHEGRGELKWLGLRFNGQDFKSH